jgi:dCMP deaminase
LVTWDAYLINLAEAVSLKSKDPRTKVGCVIVGPEYEVRSVGFNGLPRHLEDSTDRYERPLKSFMCCHAEENACMAAAKVGIPLKHCIAYVSLPPCCRCARALIQAGIVEVVVNGSRESTWSSPEYAQELALAEAMLTEAGIEVRRA